VLRSKVDIFIRLHRERRRSRERAAILDGLFPGATGLSRGALLVGALGERLAGVESARDALAGRIGEVAAKESFQLLEQELEGLRAAHEALFGRREPEAP
jgi:hypothetical protein